MGDIIRFPVNRDIVRTAKHLDRDAEPATVIILPAVRIERHSDEVNGSTPVNGAIRLSGQARRARRRRIAR